jgi:diguanylate cyclase (GGDEF)-like protein
MAETGAFGDCGDPVAFVSMMMQKLRNKKFPKRSIIYSPFSQKVIEVKRYILTDGGLCVIFTDITKQEQYHQQLIDQAHTDSLTNILNRKGIISALDELIAACNDVPENKENERASFYLLFIDLDLFKLANDTYGHKFGDALLALTSQRLSSLIDAQNGDFLGRLGGDEFIIVLRSITQQEIVVNFCQEIIESFTEPFKIDQQAVFISCSIGVSSYPRHGDSSESLLRKADTAMYHAKTQGRKLTQFYNAELSDKLIKSTLVVDELKSQLLNKRDELSLLYQPIINLRTMEIVGSEALLRWKPLNRFFLNTQQFIEMLEQRKMITEVGNIVFERALSTYQELRQKMPTKSRLSLNVSALQINHKDFADSFFEIRNQFDVPSEELILELTETALLHNSHYVKDNMEAVRAEGINLAIDDFGTGFSSLSNLKEYPFTHLKIDRSFMDEMITNPRHRRLVGAILDLSRAFGLKTIAEGIETTEQLHFLRDKGCQFGQGYLFDRPLEIDQLLTRTNYQHLYTNLHQP